MSSSPGLFSIFGELVGGLWNLGAQTMRDAETLSTQANAARAARAAERASRMQQQKWLDDVRRQNARGKAGNASPEDAAAALRGRGGRPNKLDNEWF
jgi:hypothetical protein